MTLLSVYLLGVFVVCGCLAYANHYAEVDWRLGWKGLVFLPLLWPAVLAFCLMAGWATVVVDIGEEWK